MIGTTVLHYTITGEIGAGGMGKVYLARDTRTDRKVALKFLGAEAESREARDRLLGEARAAARLSHPGIVALHAVEEADGRLFLVQEFVEGETLAKRLEKGALGTQECLRLARELAAALAHAHAQGVIHRDLKPENVLIAADGSYKIADFGIARVEGGPALTQTGMLVGTLAYMAPERLRGNRGDAKSDLFSFGAILYEAQTGRRAFSGGTEAEVLYSVLNEDPPPPAVLSPSAEPLARLAVRLLAKEPRERPASAELVSGLLEEMAEAGRITSTSATASTSGAASASGVSPAALASAATRREASPSRRSIRSSPVLPALLIVALLALVAVLWWKRGSVTASRTGEPSIAVFYFENLADPEDRERMGPVTGNLLITSLAQAEQVDVLSTQRILAILKELGEDKVAVDRGVALQVAKKARAGRLVTGSILQTKPNIVMTAEVSDVATGKVVHATRIEGAPGETVFQVVDQLGARLVDKISPAGEAKRLEPVATRASADLEAYRSYVEGLDDLSRGSLDEAVLAFRRALDRDPEFAQAHYQLAIVLWWMHRQDEAKESLAAAERHAARLSVKEREFVAGLNDLVRGDYEKAESWFARLAADYPEDPLIFYALVEASFHHDNYPRAIDAARRALALDPDFTIAGVHLADALQRTGRLAEAEKVAREMLVKDPRNSLLAHSLGAILIQQGKGKETLELAIRGRSINPKDPIAFTTGVFLLLASDSLESARAWIADGTDRSPELSEQLRLALDYWIALRRGRFREADRIATRAWKKMPITAVDMGPAIPGAHGLSEGIIRLDTKRALARAESVAVRLARWGLDPSIAVAGKTLVVSVHLMSGNTALATAELRKMESSVRRGGPGVKYLDQPRALLAHAESRHRKALDLVEKSHWSGGPVTSGSEKRLMRARILEDMGNHPAALAQIDTLMGAPLLEPDEAVLLHFRRGRILEKLGRRAEAEASYRKFLGIWKSADPGLPDVEEARVALRRLNRAG